MPDTSTGFLGRGWQFPPRFTLSSDPNGDPVSAGSVEMAAADQDIRQSLIVLFATLRGERIMRPDYGLGVHPFVLGPMDETHLGELRSQIEDAILFFEPRIKIDTIDMDTSGAPDGCLHIHLHYWIPAINSRSNMVYPYYFSEGTNVSAP